MDDYFVFDFGDNKKVVILRSGKSKVEVFANNNRAKIITNDAAILEDLDIMLEWKEK